VSVWSLTLSAAGRALAARLPYATHHGDLGPTLRARWGEPGVDGFVVFAAVGATVRIVGPLLADKHTDPAVVCVDEAGRFAIALCGGHGGGANTLARTVADRLDAVPVVTTATDASGSVALDSLPGVSAEGDVAGVTLAMLDGRSPAVTNPLAWPLPPELLVPADHPGPERIVVTDAADRLEETSPRGTSPRGTGHGGTAPDDVREDAAVPGAGMVVLRPHSLVLGIGTSSTTTPDEVAALVHTSLNNAGLSPSSLAAVATIDRRAHHPAILGLGLPVLAFPAGELSRVDVPTPSAVVRDAVGTASVSEAAALLGAGAGGSLVVTKQTSPGATVAVARRSGPLGTLTLVGLGPGHPEHRTPAATAAVQNAGVVIGYHAYVDQCADLLRPDQRVILSPLGEELDRARQAVDLAAAGEDVAMVCSGDAGVYAMASPVIETAGAPGAPPVAIRVVPGVTAALASAALLGAPIGHDHVSISLSDLLTPWEEIERRLDAAAGADLVVVLYNPRSRRRTWQLDKAIALLARARPPGAPVGIVTDAGRPGARVEVTTIATFDPTVVTMTSCVIVGASTTVLRRGRMVTPRGYRP
jgi:cobalt-precorrin 5A hydrolase/precorrin-3B C17-methyltransferase